MATEVLGAQHAAFEHASAAGVLALLDEDDVDIQRHSLQQLNQMVDFFWSEISDQVAVLEEMSEDEAFPDRDLAASIASKCYYHLEEYDDAMRLALTAGKYFDINVDSEYVQTIVAKCIDEYIALRRTEATAATEADAEEPVGEESVLDAEAIAQGVSAQPSAATDSNIDPAMLAIVERMYEKCYNSSHFRQAMGVAFEAQDLPRIEQTLAASSNSPDLLAFCFKLCQTADITRGFRKSVLGILATKYRSLGEPDYISVCQCLMYLNDAKGVADILCDMAEGDDLKLVKALQVAFVLVENQNQQFMMDVCAALRLPKPAGGEAATASSVEVPENNAAPPSEATTDASSSGTAAAERADRKRKTEGSADGEDGAPDTKRASVASSPRELPAMSEEYIAKVQKLKGVLDGSQTIDAHLAFLCRNNMTGAYKCRSLAPAQNFARLRALIIVFFRTQTCCS